MIRLLRPLPRPHARARLVCLPHAGGGGAAFSSWAELLDPDVELLAVTLPGREALAGERPVDDLAALVDMLCDGLAPEADRRLLLFGHSMGALVAYELARELRRRGAGQPGHLFVSAYPAPHLADEYRTGAHELDDRGFLDAMAAWGSGEPDGPDGAEASAGALPALRADVAVCERYAYTAEPPLAAPISAFGGINDDQVPREALQGWSLHTGAGFRLRMLPGGHLFHRESAARMLRAVNKDIG